MTNQDGEDQERLSTRALVEAGRRGDREALDTLLRRHLPALRAFLRVRMGRGLGPRESPSDLVQVACCHALERLDQYEWQGEGSFRNWLFTVAVRRLQHRARLHGAQKRARGREQPRRFDVDGEDRSLAEVYATLITPSRQLSAREEVERVEGALATLPDHYREVVVMSRLVGLTCREIGERSGRSEAATRKLLSRALARLAAELASDRSPPEAEGGDEV